jgi:hypothetical protein
MINYIDFRYSKSKGQTKAGQVFSSSINMGKSDPNYSSNLVENELLGQIDQIHDQEVVLPWAPVILDTFTIETADESVVGVCDANGNVTGAGIDSGTLTPDGKLKVKFTNPSATADVIVSYRFDNESVRSDGPTQAGFTNVPEVELKINSIPVVAQARTMRAFWAFDAQYELQKELA